VTLLAVELVLPEAASHLHGEALLHRLLDAWPRVLAFGTSFLFIANFWVGHNMIFFQVRRFDGVLMWLALVQLMCIAFLPSPPRSSVSTSRIRWRSSSTSAAS
jgi:uncharacterized membrane protein